MEGATSQSILTTFGVPGQWHPIAEHSAGCLLAVVAGATVGYFWQRAAISDGKVQKFMGSRPIAVLLTATGAAHLAGWGISAPGAIHGFFWVIGVIVGVWYCGTRLVKDYAAVSDPISSSETEAYCCFVRRTLFQEGHSETHRKAHVELRRLRNETARRQLLALDCLHTFIHHARDDAVQYVAAYSSLVSDALERQDFEWLEERMTEEFRRYLGNNLRFILSIFEALFGNPGNLWVAIRRIDKSGNQAVYRTFLRVGAFQQNRHEASEDIAENVGLPAALRRQYRNHNGIIRLGKKRKANWKKTKNDGRGEDLSVMAGPVMVLRDKQTAADKPEMAWILYVNSPDENRFAEHDEHFMRCCTDVLSMFFSMAPNFIFHVEKAEST